MKDYLAGMMKVKNLKLWLFSAVAVTVFLFFNSCGNGDWQVSQHAGFSIEFPGTPKDTVTQEGEFVGAKIFYEPVEGSLDSNLYYSITSYSLPDSLAKLGNNVNDYLRTEVQIYAWSIGGSLVDAGKPVKNGETDGMEYKVVLSSNAGVATVRKYIYGKQLYTLLVLTDNDHLSNAAITHFMNSFSIKKN